MLDFLLDEDEEKLNLHQMAWYSGDSQRIKELADSYKESAESELFSILNDLNLNKSERNIAQSENYSKFAIDSYFSGSPDTVYAAYVANLLLGGLSDQAHYNYMLHAIPKGKRFIKKGKLDEDVHKSFKIALLKKIYQVSSDRAEEYYLLLTKKGLLSETLKQYQAYVTDDFLKSFTKNVKLQKELKAIL